MPVRTHNPPELFPPYRAYSHAVEIAGGAQLLIISGLNGYLAHGVTMPETFAAQGAMARGDGGADGVMASQLIAGN